MPRRRRQMLQRGDELVYTVADCGTMWGRVGRRSVPAFDIECEQENGCSLGSTLTASIPRTG
jgi:hypothetical protein